MFPKDFYIENVYLRDMPGIQAKPLASFNFKGKKWLQERLGRHRSLKALTTTQPDLFHPTYFGDYYLRVAQAQKTPFILTIHDMIHEKYAHGGRGLFSLDAGVIENKRLLAMQAAAIVVVSENTRKDVLELIPGVDPAKIHTIHHGNSMPPRRPDQANNMLLPDNYLLFVGQRKAYKNFSWMLDQIAGLLQEDRTLHLVCAGGPAFDAAETEKMTAWGITSQIVHPRIGSDADLAELYSRARCFVFPSIYEGFGIPVLEAFACGCPVVLCGASCLPEVGGDAALYFPEGDGQMLKTSLYSLLRDPQLAVGMIAKGYERLKQFSWQKSVDAHLNLYQRVLASK